MTSRDRAHRAFVESFGAPPTIMASAPGRVNLIGEHTDYNEGWVLPAAIDRRAWVAASACVSPLVTLHALDLEQHVTFRLNDLGARLDSHGHPLPAWARYPAGVAFALQEVGCTLVGLDAVLTSDVPIGAGLSSSAALETAFALTWVGLSKLELDRLTLAKLCQRAENEYVGVHSGLMDPYTALHAAEGCALFLDCRHLTSEPIPLPSMLALVIADSGVRHTLGASAYNLRRQECAEAARQLGNELPGVSSLRDVTSDDLARWGRTLTPVLRQRAEHVVGENARVHTAVECLRAGDVEGLGAILTEGHASLRDRFEVSHPDVDTLVDLAEELPGCYGSRLTGGGFGGSTISVVEKAEADGFAAELSIRYEKATGHRGQVWICRPGEAAAYERMVPTTTV